ncbi:restriction endonuclease subunit S, partial [Thiolapillus sp.]|uniref:restriction endonuclease subunit S n=1 Tax=Thiolapillus sp. TaxID=2017437 RepID=UPI0027E2D083
MSSKSDKKKSLVPRLRFPEFREAGAWEVKRLGEVANISMGASPKSASYNDQRIGLPLIQGNADIKDRKSSPRLFASQITRECWVGDILVGVRAPVGMVAKSEHHACIGRGISALCVKGEDRQEFLYQWLLWYEPHWVSISQGGTFDSVNKNEITNLVALFPNPSEQQKVAHCLSSLDEVIGLQAKKVQALKQHKKGLMQQLFPAEGETTPRLRFPDFREAGAWEVQTIDQLASKIAQGGTPKTSIPKYWNGDIPWI